MCVCVWCVIMCACVFMSECVFHSTTVEAVEECFVTAAPKTTSSWPPAPNLFVSVMVAMPFSARNHLSNQIGCPICVLLVARIHVWILTDMEI